jgi:DNA helicase-2/ATP-dependent DNA helicase PcrA
MTLHSAKGLEFPVVLIAGMEEELIPHARALEEGGNDGLEEERRLVYVGITRARERIALLHAQSRWHFGSQAPRLPSRFLQEIPDELVEGGSSEGEREEEDVLGVFDDAAAPKGLAVGAWVEHPHFGRGQVDRLSGSGVNARAAIRFTRHGVKHLLLTYAKLTVVGASR